jgi:capping protein beta
MPLDGHDLASAHVANMGRVIEEMENKLRNSLQEIYFGKTKDIVNDLRSVRSIAEKQKQDIMTRELAGKLSSGGK